MVYVEAGVYEGGGAENGFPDITFAGCVVRHWRIREQSRGRVDEIVVQEGGVAAGVGLLVEVGYKGGVEREKGSKVVDICNGRDWA